MSGQVQGFSTGRAGPPVRRRSQRHAGGMQEDEVRWGRRPGVGWTPVTYGAHVRADLADDLSARLRAWQLVLPFWSSFTG